MLIAKFCSLISSVVISFVADKICFDVISFVVINLVTICFVWAPKNPW